MEVLPSRALVRSRQLPAVDQARSSGTLTRRDNVMKVGMHVHTNRDLPKLEEAEPSEYAHSAWRTTPPHARLVVPQAVRIHQSLDPCCFRNLGEVPSWRTSIAALRPRSLLLSEASARRSGSPRVLRAYSEATSSAIVGLGANPVCFSVPQGCLRNAYISVPSVITPQPVNRF